MVVAEVNWRDGWPRLAACRWYPEYDWDSDVVFPHLAEVCGRCPVRGECLMAALDFDPKVDVGVWGGTSPWHRQRIRQGRIEPWDVWKWQGMPYEETTHGR